jgi:hypothetical protein
MTPANMFNKFGDNERLSFVKGDNVITPIGTEKVEYEFTRGLKWWTKTTNGTFLSKTINQLNQK